MLCYVATDWKKRSEACQRIQAIAFLFDKVCSGELSKMNIHLYIQQVNKLAGVLNIQVSLLASPSADFYLFRYTISDH